MTTYKQIEARVRRGAAFLDKTYGKTWRKKVNLKILNLDSASSCILGQTYHNYGEHVSKLGLSFRECVSFGFVIDGFGVWTPNERAENRDEYERLTAAWKGYLKPKREKK